MSTRFSAEKQNHAVHTEAPSAAARSTNKDRPNLETMHSLQGTKIALLIDFDNVILGVEDPGFDVELVVNALRSRGVVVMGRAYGDWYRHHRHRRKLMEQGIELVETPVFGPLIKNSADIRIVLDGIDIATAHTHIDTFCLVSGDSDFLPLIKRLQLLGKNVIVIAGTSSPVTWCVATATSIWHTKTCWPKASARQKTPARSMALFIFWDVPSIRSTSAVWTCVRAPSNR
jgi:uncharacterized protein (TIGR00288 family)